MDKNLSEISELSIFRGIAKKDMVSILSQIQYRIKSYPKKSAIILQGAPYDALHIITHGYCIGVMTSESSKTVKIDDLHAPQILGSALLFALDNRMPVSIWAKSDTQVMILKKQDVLKLCRLQEPFLVNLLTDVGNKFTFLTDKIAYLEFKSLEDRFLFYLSKQDADSDGFIHLTQSFDELSSLFGVERPSLSRAVARMEKRGYITRKKKLVKVRKEQSF